MHNSFTQPTPEQRLQALQNYGERSDRLVRERERQRITSVSRSMRGNLNEQAASLYVSRLGQNLVPGC
jgi:hypothetical protein